MFIRLSVQCVSELGLKKDTETTVEVSNLHCLPIFPGRWRYISRFSFGISLSQRHEYLNILDTTLFPVVIREVYISLPLV